MTLSDYMRLMLAIAGQILVLVVSGCTPSKHLETADRSALDWRVSAAHLNDVRAFFSVRSSRFDSIVYNERVPSPIGGQGARIRMTDWIFGGVEVAGIPGAFEITNSKQPRWLATSTAAEFEFGDHARARQQVDSLRELYTVPAPTSADFLRVADYMSRKYGAPQSSQDGNLVVYVWPQEGLELTHSLHDGLIVTFRGFR